MRVLAACPHCARQFDATGRAPRSRFRCLCGSTLSVPDDRAYDAAIVRCSACGAPREQDVTACAFCGAEFTLHERDLHTICPICMARVSDRARYCHHCATPLLPQPLGQATKHPCPACGDEAALSSRSLSDDGVPVLECQRCAGLWLGREAFAVVLDRARRHGGADDDPKVARPVAPQPQTGALYRPCPECGVLMHRRNYGRRSGVIVDSCAAHGLWFDGSELDRLLSWVRRGGETAAALRHNEEQGQLERRRRLLNEPGSETGAMESNGGNVSLLHVLREILSWFLG